MKQVFVSTTSTALAAGSDQTFGFAAPGEMGIWGNNEDNGQGDFFATALVATTMVETDTDGAVAGTTLGRGVPLKPFFQLVQGMPAGTNPIASPIINTSDVLSIDYITYVAAAKGKSVWTLDGLTPAVGEELEFRLLVTFDGDVTNYDAQINGAATKIGLGLHANKIIPFSYKCGSATLDTEGAAIAAAINAANSPLSRYVTAAYVNGTDDLTITAKSFDTSIKVLDLNMISGDFLGAETVDVTSTLVTDTAPIKGSGNYHQVLSEEKAARYSQGNFNRMYFPDAYTSYVASGGTYEQVRITYKNNTASNVFHGGNAGVSELVFYWPEVASGATTWDTVFGFTVDTTSKILVAG